MIIKINTSKTDQRFFFLNCKIIVADVMSKMESYLSVKNV